jgi:FAD:protein FMN transferase
MSKLTRQIINFACILAVVFSAWIKAEGADAGLHRFNFERVEMGVIFRLSVYASDSGVANKAAEAAYARVHDLNGIFSDYEGSSEVRRLCDNSGPGRPVRVSEELFKVLEASLQLSRETDGAFDVTVGPLTKLWRRARRREQMPVPALLAEAKRLVDYRLIRLDSCSRSVELLRDGMRIDFGGIAKGFATDEALRILSTFGLTRALVDAGGDIAAGDPPPGTDFWVIAIESLRQQKNDEKQNDVQITGKVLNLKLRNQAVATSGDAYQSVVIAGRRYSHIVNPATGLGLDERSSVTVIAPSGMLADGLASAVSVLGPAAGIQLVERPGKCGVEAFVMFAKGESGLVRARQSSGLEAFLQDQVND